MVPSFDPAGAASNHGQGRPTLENRVVKPVHEVVGHPDGVIAQALGLDSRIDGGSRFQRSPVRRTEEGWSGNWQRQVRMCPTEAQTPLASLSAAGPPSRPDRTRSPNSRNVTADDVLGVCPVLRD